MHEGSYGYSAMNTDKNQVWSQIDITVIQLQLVSHCSIRVSRYCVQA